eukprot:476408_1
MDVCVAFKDEFDHEGAQTIESIIKALNKHRIPVRSTEAWMQQMTDLLDAGQNWIKQNHTQRYDEAVSCLIGRFYAIHAAFIVQTCRCGLDEHKYNGESNTMAIYTICGDECEHIVHLKCIVTLLQLSIKYDSDGNSLGYGFLDDYDHFTTADVKKKTMNEAQREIHDKTMKDYRELLPDCTIL